MVEKKSLKPIPPTLRGKKRYVKFSLISNAKFNLAEVRNEIWFVFGRIFGEKGIAEQKLWLVNWDGSSNSGIIRCSLEKVEEVKGGLLFLQEISRKKVIPVIEGVSGSVKKLKERN